MAKTNGARGRSAPDPEASAPRITRSEVAKILGVTKSTVGRYDRAKLLTSKKQRIGDHLGVHTYDRADVEALAASMPSTSSTSSTSSRGRATRDELAVRTWELFSEGRALLDVVLEVRRLHPDEVRRLLDSFRSPSHVVLSPAHARQLAALGFGDSRGVVSGASIIAAAERLLASARELRARTREASDEDRSSASSGPRVLRTGTLAR